MKASDLILRCYLKRSADQWIAVCIDLCLAVQAESPQEARRKLDQQIHAYVEEALTIDREHAAELLTRKAPIGQRLEYLAIRSLVGLHFCKNKLGQAFKISLPVHVGHSCPA